MYYTNCIISASYVNQCSVVLYVPICMGINVYMCVCVCVYMYIYIYIYCVCVCVCLRLIQ